MVESLLVILIFLVIVAVVLLIVMLTRSPVLRLLQIENQIASFERNQERIEKTLKEEMAQNRDEGRCESKQMREEVGTSLKSFNESLLNQMKTVGDLQRNQLDSFSKQLVNLTRFNEQRLEKMRETIEERLRHLQEDNTKKLEQMRETVDEKLHTTLEKRLGESFKLVSDRLEMVHKGLGEMQSLASSVGDLKKVLSNVKARGILGEIQLGAILEQILTIDQYAKNVATKKGSSERVEYAIKLPGRDDQGTTIWLPIDAKFYEADYQRLLEAYEHGDHSLVEDAAKQLETKIKNSAKEIRDKYLDPPNTTDFGIMFLPVEGLYAEVLRRHGFFELLQRDYKVTVTGPTTLSAFLNSLQMGFRTLTIEKRSSEVWALLGAVKTEFGKFGTILEKTHKKLQEASNTIEDAARKSRTIERRLKEVQELPSSDAAALIGDTEDLNSGDGN
ncbi:MAG: DNA recombination protein RmuC [Deltaproteobacteria bacterium]|nr:DNA recombination protein RmuC [Deltaproteobacteria bacterium]